MFKRLFPLAIALACLTGCVSMTPQVTSKSEAVSKASLNDMGAKGRRLEMPSMNTGTGAHDFYSLFTLLPPSGPAKYGIGIAAANKFSTTDATLSMNGSAPLKLEGSQDVSLLLVIKVNYVEGTFDREQLEKAVTAGARFQIASSKGSLDFAVPGWMFAALLEAADQHDGQRQNRQKAANYLASMAKYREVYLQAHPEIDEKTRNAILQGKLLVGMVPQQVEVAWGFPERVNETNAANGAHLQWIYGNNYVYFHDGKLTSWQTIDKK